MTVSSLENTTRHVREKWSKYYSMQDGIDLISFEYTMTLYQSQTKGRISLKQFYLPFHLPITIPGVYQRKC
jgi:hypothetical protein